MIASTIIISTLLSLSSALPTSKLLNERAGAPAIKPIPDTCSVTSALPVSEAADTYYEPTDDAKKALLYWSYYGNGDWNATEKSTQCNMQCYGYGPDCKGAFWANNLVVPKGYYGSPGGSLSTGCLLFNRDLVAADFKVADVGRATDSAAANIKC